MAELWQLGACGTVVVSHVAARSKQSWAWLEMCLHFDGVQGRYVVLKNHSRFDCGGAKVYSQSLYTVKPYSTVVCLRV